MSYFDETNNANFYSSLSGGFYSYPPPSQTLPVDNDGSNDQIFADPADQWNTVRQSGPMFGSAASLQPTASFGECHSDCSIDWCLTREPPESVAPTTPYTSETDDYNWLSYGWSANQQPQSNYSTYLSRDGSFASTAPSETFAVAHTPASGEYLPEEFGGHRSQTSPFDYWGSLASTSTSYVVGGQFQSPLRNPADTFSQGDVNTAHWPGTDPTGAEVTRTEWYQPSGVTRTRPNWYTNAEAGPSTLVAPPVQYLGLPTTQPPGGISETRANAQSKQTITEEHRVPVSIFYCSYIPRVTEWLFGVRNPSELDFLVVKGGHAPPVNGADGLATTYASGYGTGGTTAPPQRSIRLWPVSKPPISNDAPD